MRFARILAVPLHEGLPVPGAKIILSGPVNAKRQGQEGEWLGCIILKGERLPFYGRPDGNSIRLVMDDEDGFASISIVGKVMESGNTFAFYGAGTFAGMSECLCRIEAVSGLE